MPRAGIPIVEITMTVPGALDVIAELTRSMPDLVVGAGTILDVEDGPALRGRGRAVPDQPGAGSGDRGVCAEGRHPRHPRRADTHGGDRRVAGRCRFRQGLPVRATGRRELHPRAEGAVSFGAVRGGGRRQSADSGRVHHGRSLGDRRRFGVDSQERRPAAGSALDHASSLAGSFTSCRRRDAAAPRDDAALTSACRSVRDRG